MDVLWVLAGLIAVALVYVFVIKPRSNVKAEDSGIKSGGVAAAAGLPVVQAGIEEETVAAIMAAISCMTEPDSGARYVVKSISRSKSERPVWGFAGIQQNTRPF